MKFISSSLVFRLSLLFLIFALIPVFIMTVFGTREITIQFQRFVERHSKEDVLTVAQLLLLTGSNAKKEDVLNAIKKKPGLFFIIDASGKISMLSTISQEMKKVYTKDYLRGIKENIISKTYTDNIDYDSSTLINVAPLNDGAYLVRIFSTRKIENISAVLIRKVDLFVLFAILFSAILLGIFIYLLIGRPLRILTQASKHISEENFDISLDIDEMTGELRTFAETFLFASKKIQSTMDELRLTADTERRAKEKISVLNSELLQSTQKYEEVFNSSFVAVMIHDFEGKVLDVNQQMLEMFGFHSKEQACQYTMGGLTAKDVESSEILRIMDEVLYGKTNIFEWQCLRPVLGETFIAQVSLRQVKFGEDQQCVLANIIDITETRAAEEKLIRAQKMETVGNLAGGIAHDFNNILSGIMGPLSLMEFQIQQSGEIKKDMLEKYLQNMNDATVRATEIVKQLLSISRKSSPVFKQIDLNDSLASVRKIAENSFDKSVKLKFEPYVGQAIVNADPTQVEQIFLNLAVNAEHAMTLMRPDGISWGGELYISLERIHSDAYLLKQHGNLKLSTYFKISIRDTGVGMSPSVLKQIFNPFYTTKEDEKGTGLGLSMVHNIISLHHGALDVYSEEGKGTVFILYLPQAEKVQNVAEVDLVAEDKTDIHGTILVVDDEEMIRINARDMLEYFGHTVFVAGSGQEGMDIFREHFRAIDLVILDMAMPGMSGKEVLPGLQKINAEVKVVLSSGFRGDKRVSEAIEAGTCGFIQKPYTMKELLSSVADALSL